MNLYVVSADGSRLRRVTHLRGNELVPVWSPRGSKIAFEVEDDADRSIWVMNADGSRPRQVTSGFDRGFEHPAWSPDSTKIAFNQLQSGWIYVMNTDGQKLQRVALSRQHAAPQWSPAGKVAYFSNGYIWLVNPDGSARQRAINTKSRGSTFQWSPDGKTIAFAGLGTTGRDDEILLANAGGKTKRSLTDNDVQDTNPSWSPDGKALAFLRYRDGGNPHAYDVYVINVDGEGERNLTKTAVDESRPVWSPSRR
jgi:TolB protein